MSTAIYKDNKFVGYSDFECPLCGELWDNSGDPYEQEEEVEEECPKCKATLIITATYSVSYDVVAKDSPESEAQNGSGHVR